ncbi:MAG: DUF3876 domain-containing protein [Alistipes sp.]|nr:DUF3876 domain-containing protein [Alistipes sp.]
MKHLLWIAATAVLALAVPLLLWRLADDPLAWKTEPLLGEWLSTFDGQSRLDIRIAEEGASITVYRAGDGFRRGRTYPLHHDTCLHYTDGNGRRVDLFYTPPADALLLVPGGAFKRISNLKDYEQ